MKKLFSIALSLLLMLTCLPGVAGADGPEAVTIVGGVNEDSAVEIDNSLLVYPLHLMASTEYAYYTFTAPVDGTYYFRFGSTNMYNTNIHDSNGSTLSINGAGSLYIIELTAGQTLVLKITPQYNTYSTLTICNDTNHVSDGKDYLAHPVSCCTDGQRAYICKYCTQMFGYTTIPATGHTLGDWGYYPAATCTTDGAFGQQCSACGEVVNAVELPALGHVHSDPVVVLEPTDRQPGMMVVTCTECGETISTTVIPAVTE